MRVEGKITKKQVTSNKIQTSNKFQETRDKYQIITNEQETRDDGRRWADWDENFDNLVPQSGTGLGPKPEIWSGCFRPNIGYAAITYSGNWAGSVKTQSLFFTGV